MPVASAARELTPLPDDAGLRTVLRNVPLLPAPANVDDLVARLDAEEVPVSSGPLAELISDARYIEPASNATHSDEANDHFFAPVSRAVNTNRRPPLAPRLSSGLFNAALVAGALLILWNALLAPDGAPPPATPMKTAESATASDLTKAPALTVAADEPMPETGTDNAMSPNARVAGQAARTVSASRIHGCGGLARTRTRAGPHNAGSGCGSGGASGEGNAPRCG